jgi:hypothetical protein
VKDAGSVEVIIANQLLEHVKELFWLMHEVTRVLAPGGKVILGIPNLASLHNRLLLLLGKQPTSIQTDSPHIRGFTREGVLKFVSRCFPSGYALKGFGGSNFYPFPATVAKPLAAAFPRMAWGIFFLLEKVRAYDGEFLTYAKENAPSTSFFLGDDAS